MVFIKDTNDSSESKSDLSIFPPINHENLHSSFSPFSSSPSASTSSFSQSDSDNSDIESLTETTVAEPSDWRWWIGIGLEALRAKAFRLAKTSFGGNGVVWWKASGIVVTTLIWSLWIRARYRRRLEDLTEVVKTKDEVSALYLFVEMCQKRKMID